MANTFTPTCERGRIFVKPTEESEAEWKEIGIVSNDSVTLSGRDGDAQSLIKKPTRFSCSFSCRINKNTFIRLMQLAGALKVPRCTYKTIKNNCAKRNRFKR